MTDDLYVTPGEATPAPGLMQRAAAQILPLARHAPKNPLLLIGAAALGVAGVLAWRNRRRISQAARPMLQNAAARGRDLRGRLPWAREASSPADAAELLH